MIELRWVSRMVPLCAGSRYGTMEKFLQYRIMQTYTLGETIHNEWMPWVDVPTIQGGTNETP